VGHPEELRRHTRAVLYRTIPYGASRVLMLDGECASADCTSAPLPPRPPLLISYVNDRPREGGAALNPLMSLSLVLSTSPIPCKAMALPDRQTDTQTDIPEHTMLQLYSERVSARLCDPNHGQPPSTYWSSRPCRENLNYSLY
jgi:hypothetical protein